MVGSERELIDKLKHVGHRSVIAECTIRNSKFGFRNAKTSPQWSKSYVFLGGRLLSTLSPNYASGTPPTTESVQYHHPDRLGTRLITNASDTTVTEQTTLPFGTALTTESGTTGSGQGGT